MLAANRQLRQRWGKLLLDCAFRKIYGLPLV